MKTKIKKLALPPVVSKKKINPNFTVGFEFEGCILRQEYESFINGLMKLSRHISYGTDNSIQTPSDYYISREIRTNKLSYKAAKELLNKILDYLAKASENKIFVTNKSCGLHINISEKSIFKNNKQTIYYGNLLCLIDEKKILSRFGRGNNRYCIPFSKIAPDLAKEKNPEKIQKMLDDLRAAGYNIRDRNHIKSKYLAIALRDGYDDYDNTKYNERIEFRALGNKDYELKKDKIKLTLKEILKACTDAFHVTQFKVTVPELPKKIEKPKKATNNVSVSYGTEWLQRFFNSTQPLNQSSLTVPLNPFYSTRNSRL